MDNNTIKQYSINYQFKNNSTGCIIVNQSQADILYQILINQKFKKNINLIQGLLLQKDYLKLKNKLIDLGINNITDDVINKLSIILLENNHWNPFHLNVYTHRVQSIINVLSNITGLCQGYGFSYQIRNYHLQVKELIKNSNLSIRSENKNFIETHKEFLIKLAHYLVFEVNKNSIYDYISNYIYLSNTNINYVEQFIDALRLCKIFISYNDIIIKRKEIIKIFEDYILKDECLKNFLLHKPSCK